MESEGDDQANKAYRSELRVAEGTDLSLVQDKQIVIVVRNEDGSLARDRSGSPTVVLTPSLVPQNSTAWEKSFRMFLLETREICEESYRVVYIHSGFAPPWWFSWWLVGLRARVSRPHRKNISGLTIIHPTIGIRLLFLALRPLLGANFWNKLHYADRIEELWLDEVMGESIAKRSIPRVVFAYELKIELEADETREAAIMIGAPLNSREPEFDPNRQ